MTVGLQEAHLIWRGWHAGQDDVFGTGTGGSRMRRVYRETTPGMLVLAHVTTARDDRIAGRIVTNAQV